MWGYLMPVLQKKMRENPIHNDSLKGLRTYDMFAHV